MNPILAELYKEVKGELNQTYSFMNAQMIIKNNHLVKIEKIGKELVEIEEELDTIKKARIVIQGITDSRNSEAKQAIKELINYSFDVVFENNKYDLHITDDMHGNNKTTIIELEDKYTGKFRSPKKGIGNAAKQIISFLFIASLEEFAKKSKLQIIDEALNCLDEYFAPRFGDIIVSLAKNNGFQFLIVNHHDVLFKNPEFGIIKVVVEDPAIGLVVKEVID